MTQSYSWAWNCLSVVVTCLKKNVLCQWSLSKKSVFLEWTVNRRPADARPQVAGWPLGNVLLADRLRYISTPTVGPPPRPVPFHPMCLRLLETFDCVSFWRIKGKRCRKWRLSWKRCSCLFASVDSWLAGNYEKPVCVRWSTARVGNLRSASTFDMARRRIFFTQFRVQNRVKTNLLDKQVLKTVDYVIRSLYPS